MSLQNIHRAIEAAFPAHLEAIRDFVRTPSISIDGTGITETAEQVKRFVQDTGGEAKVVPTKGHPVVYGELMLGKPKTLLVYGMYDVMPVEGEEWVVPPFGGEITELPGLGRCLVNRGVYNTKGPLRGFLNVVSTMQGLGSLPVNLKFLFEGEEELGSKHLPDFIAEYKDRLDCDAVFFPWFALNRRGRPITYLGAKGMIHVELVCQGGDWGGPRSSGVHSSYGAWVSSPLWKLVHALSSMVDEHESITIDGFYEDVREPTAEDEELLANLEGVFDETMVLEENDIARFKYDGLHGSDLLREYLFSPMINIDGLLAGYTGPGVKTVIGHRAVAKLDIRLIPDMTVEDTLKKVRDHLICHGYEDVRLQGIGGYGWSRTSVKEDVVQALHESYRYHGYEAEIWPYIGGSAPFHLFTKELGLPLVMGGLCHGGGAHGPNEYAVLDQIELYEESIATFLFQYAFGSLK
jgi:acetylornithine deacetylase/succinyl-diaminopimelate desuccinylase-like protein